MARVPVKRCILLSAHYNCCSAARLGLQSDQSTREGLGSLVLAQCRKWPARLATGCHRGQRWSTSAGCVGRWARPHASRKAAAELPPASPASAHVWGGVPGRAQTPPAPHPTAHTPPPRRRTLIKSLPLFLFAVETAVRWTNEHCSRGCARAIELYNIIVALS